MKFDKSGRIAFSTYVGGSGMDLLRSLAVDAAGGIVVVGQTNSSNYPVTSGVVQSTFGGFMDAVVTKLSADGKRLVFSTFLGGARSDDAKDVHVDANLVVTVTGVAATGFPTTTGAFQRTLPSTKNFYNGFVSRLRADGKSFVYSTYLGGTNFGFARAVAVDKTGQVTVVGQSGSNDFPTTTGSYQPKYQGNLGANFMAFVTRLDAKGSKPVWSTYLGSTDMDTAADVALCPDGSVVIAGWTRSSSFPVTNNAFQRWYAGGGTLSFRGDGFVTHMDKSGARLLASTYLGGKGMDELNRMHVDAAGNVTVFGNTGSSDVPTTPGALRTKYLPAGFPTWVGDAWIARLDPTLSQLIYSSYYGGSYTEYGNGVFFDAATNRATIVGSTSSGNLPLKNPVHRTLAGRSSAFFAEIEMLPAGTRRIGSSSPCNTVFLVEPNRSAIANDTNFALLVSGAPARAPGLMLVSVRTLANPIKLPAPLGATLYLDPAAGFLVGMTSTASGTRRFPIPLTGVPKAAKGYVQAFFANGSGCTSRDTVSSSYALEFTVQ